MSSALDEVFWRVLIRHLFLRGGLVAGFFLLAIGTGGLTSGNPLWLAIGVACYGACWRWVVRPFFMELALVRAEARASDPGYGETQDPSRWPGLPQAQAQASDAVLVNGSPVDEVFRRILIRHLFLRGGLVVGLVLPTIGTNLLWERRLQANGLYAAIGLAMYGACWRWVVRPFLAEMAAVRAASHQNDPR